METTKKQLTDYEKQGFNGVDVSLEISLFEYGLIWHENDQDGDTKFIYGVGIDREGNYNLFDYGFYNEKDFRELIEEGGWFDLRAVLSCCGYPEDKKQEWLFLPLGLRIYDCVSYYGYENIFGSSYYPFEIE